jgi:DNA-binding CsgD family transcriptional regulator/tetratricopeptide (TPR) repeat protein
VVELLERSSMLNDMSGVLADAAHGGRIVLVVGEAGIGKSALVRGFTERHEAEARFLVGACDPLLTPRALGPLHDLGRQTGGRLAALLSAGGPREELFAACLDELDQRRQVVVVEDAHWADEATLDLLVFLGRRMDRTRTLLIVTYRDDELAADHPLRTVVGRLPPEMVRRLQLEPLTETAVAELARRAGRQPGGLHTLTGGNPLLVTEVLAAGDTGVPLTVRDLVLARFGGLPPPAQEVARLVAVVPTRAELWLVEQAATGGAVAPAVEAAAAAGLLVVGPDAVRFRHELLRRAVEDSLSVLARRELNRRILDVLASNAERHIDVARLVHHARAAGDVDALLRYAPHAARRAAEVGAHREAVEHYRTVMEHAMRLPEPIRADLLEEYSVECYLSGLSIEAVSARRSAVDLREAAGDRERVGESLRWLSRLHWWDGNRPEAEAAAARAITVLETVEPGRQLAMAYSNQAQLDMLDNRLEVAMRWAGRAIELAQRFDDQETLSHALTNIGSARLISGDPGGRAELERGYEVALAAGLEDHAARALCNLGTIGAEALQYAHAREDLDRGLAFVRAHELSGYVQHILGHRARVRLDQGDWAGAEEDARAALAEDVRGGARVVDGLVPLGLVQARRGDPAAAATLDQAAEHGFATVELQWTAPVAAARAEHAWLHGEDDRAAREAQRMFGQVVEAGHPWFAGELAVWLQRSGARPPIPTAVAEPYRLLLEGDWRAGAEAWGELGCPYHRALALAGGDDDEALVEALALLDGLGARQTAQRLRREFRRRGNLRVPRGPNVATAANPAGLTGRQVEVLALLVEGLSDAEIAARLSLSAKTVGHHVSAVLAKLGVGSRREAAAAAGRLGVSPGPAGSSGRRDRDTSGQS